ncbi:hypothetical protein P3G55_26930 [Leptospira sp. 96542]|nr:hypothetical protein [Leptospira sp. 96542]
MKLKFVMGFLESFHLFGFPRGGGWPMAWVVLGLMLAGLAGVTGTAASTGATETSTGLQELSVARAVVQVTGQEPMALGEVGLPYHWDRAHVGRSGRAEFELRFDARDHDLAPGEPYGIYLPRVGNTAEVWLNGTLLERLGDLDRPNTAD